MRVAFLGLGAMGWPMAARVAQAHDLTVWNRTTAKAEALAAQHPCRVAASPREAVAAAEVAVTCLPTSAEVEALLDGPDGLAAGLAPGAALVDCTSGSPAACVRLAERLAARGCPFLDCPVSGGTSGAAAGTLTVMAGGDAAALSRVRPVLESFGRNIVHLGPAGAGCATKAVNNLFFAVNVQAFCEGMTALARVGVPADKAVEVLNGSSGRSYMSQGVAPARILDRSFPASFKLALLVKDVGIAVDLLQEAGIDAPVARAAQEALRRAMAGLPPDADFLEVVRLAEQRAGVELRSSGN